MVWAYDEKCVQCIKYQLFIWNYVNGIVLSNMTRLSSALTTKRCDGTLKDSVICDLLRVKGLRTPGL